MIMINFELQDFAKMCPLRRPFSGLLFNTIPSIILNNAVSPALAILLVVSSGSNLIDLGDLDF